MSLAERVRRAAARALVRLSLDVAEQTAGHLLYYAGLHRAERGAPEHDDIHEVRHLAAALTAGNSSPCLEGTCHLDGRRS